LTPALSHEAQEGKRWSQRFLRSLQRLQALTLRNELEAEGAGAIGDVAFAVDEESEGEGLSPSWEDSSRERLRLLIRAHGRKSAGFGASTVELSQMADELLPPHWDYGVSDHNGRGRE
jgi:hypothetical protein